MHLLVLYLFLAIAGQEDSIFGKLSNQVERRIILDKYVLPKTKEWGLLASLDFFLCLHFLICWGQKRQKMDAILLME